MIKFARLLWMAALFLALCHPAVALADKPPAPGNFSASVYGGVMTDDNWLRAVSGQAEVVDSRMLAGALSWTFLRPESRMWSLELEANIVRHFGIQDHFEINAPVLGIRWEAFPWDRVLDTDAAFGTGLSLATRTPEYERVKSGDSDPFLLFWHIEVAAGLPDSRWSTFARLHHRSTGYGLFADNGGSNILCLGLRYDF
jgi:hypothetical protein